VLKPPHMQVDMFYLQSMTCFAWTQTSYHVVPCWSSVLQLSGNTFADRSHIFLPLASLSTHKVIFPPAAKGTSVYQNIMIYNHDANTPLRFLRIHIVSIGCVISLYLFKLFQHSFETANLLSLRADRMYWIWPADITG
jgi:hypothetical protein